MSVLAVVMTLAVVVFGLTVLGYWLAWREYRKVMAGIPAEVREATRSMFMELDHKSFARTGRPYGLPGDEKQTTQEGSQ